MEKKMIEDFVANFGTGISVEKMASMVYWNLFDKVDDACIVNTKYVKLNGKEFQLIRRKSKCMWEVKEIANRS